MSVATGWQTIRLGDLVKVSYGRALGKSDRVETGRYQVFGSSGVVGHHDEPLVEGPLIVVGRKGNAGAAFLSEEGCWPIDTTYYFSIPEEVDPRFLWYQMQVLGLETKDSSTAIPSLRRPDLESAEVALAPLDEQHRIVDAIETHLSHLDAGVQSLQRAKRNIERMRAAVLQSAATPKGEAAEDWVRVRVGEVADVVTGSTPNPKVSEYWGEGAAFFTPGDLVHGREVARARRELTPLGQREARMLPAFSVLLTCIGATIGKTSLATVPCTTNQQINALVPSDAVDSRYLHLVVASPKFQQQILAHASSTTMQILNKSRLKGLTVQLPPLREQHRLVNETERQLSIVGSVWETLTVQSSRSAGLRRAVLSAAFSGRLVPAEGLAA